MEVDLIIKMGYFVQDLYNHITAVHAEQYRGDDLSGSFTVYCGEGLSHTQFEKLMKTQGGLLALNNFLSTSKNRCVSLNFARRTMVSFDLIGVLFVMKMDRSISVAPFTNVQNISYY
jgi:hypothetical protein